MLKWILPPPCMRYFAGSFLSVSENSILAVMGTYNRDKMYERQVHLYLETNPNPNSLKFVANCMLVENDDFYDFPSKEVSMGTGIAEQLFVITDVCRVFIMGNFITITKSASSLWDDLKQPLKKIIHDWLTEEKPVINIEKIQKIKVKDSLEVQKIKSILSQHIQPLVGQDGGAISFYSFEKGVVKVLLQGACNGCPSVAITLKQGVEKLLTSMVPTVVSVEAFTPNSI